MFIGTHCNIQSPNLQVKHICTPPGEPEKPKKPKGGSVKMSLSRKVNPKDSRSKKDGGNKEKKIG